MNPMLIISAIDAGTALVASLIAALSSDPGTDDEMRVKLEALEARLLDTNQEVLKYRPKPIP